MKKKSLLVFFVGLLTCGCQMKEVINEYNVVPLPVTMNEQPGRFYLNSDVPVVVNASQEVKNIASSLSTTVLDVAGIKLKPGGELHENVPTIVFDSIPGMEKEAYKLSVFGNGNNVPMRIWGIRHHLYVYKNLGIIPPLRP